MSKKYLISFKNVSLIYELFYNKEKSIKSLFVNFFSPKPYIENRSDSFYGLKDVTFDIQLGERVGIIGANGAGKSTLLKAIAGILRPQHGEMQVNGDVQPLIEIGAGFNPELSGRENIYLNGFMMGFSKKEVQAKEQEIIDFTELGHFIDVPVKYYSSGMSVRLAFAVATSIDPQILLFDEMLSAGDAQFSKKAQDRMTKLIAKASCIVLVSHDLNLIKSFCKRVIYLKKGSVVYDGDPEKAVDMYLKDGAN